MRKSKKNFGIPTSGPDQYSQLWLHFSSRIYHYFPSNLAHWKERFFLYRSMPEKGTLIGEILEKKNVKVLTKFAKIWKFQNMISQNFGGQGYHIRTWICGEKSEFYGNAILSWVWARLQGLFREKWHGIPIWSTGRYSKINQKKNFCGKKMWFGIPTSASDRYSIFVFWPKVPQNKPESAQKGHDCILCIFPHRSMVFLRIVVLQIMEKNGFENWRFWDFCEIFVIFLLKMFV